MASTMGVTEPTDEMEGLKKENQHLIELYNTSARRNEELNDVLEDLQAFVRCGVCEKLPRTVFNIDGKCGRCSKVVCCDCADTECDGGEAHQTIRVGGGEKEVEEEKKAHEDQQVPQRKSLNVTTSDGKYTVLDTDDAILRPFSKDIHIACQLCQKTGYSYRNGKYRIVLGVCKFCHHIVCEDCRSTICKEIGLPHNHNRTLSMTAETKMMNKIIAVSFHPCKWTTAGCKVQKKLKPLQLHELDCEFRDVRCPNDDCAKMVPFADLLDHFLECSETTLNDKLSLKDCIEVSVGTNKESGTNVIDVRGLRVIPVKFKEHLLFIKVGTRQREGCQLFHLYVVMNTFEGSNKYRVKVTVSYDENAMTQVLRIVPTTSDAWDECTCRPWDQNTPPIEECLDKCSEVQKAYDSRPRSVFVQHVDQLAQLCNDDEMSGEPKKMSVQLNVFEY